MSGSLQSVFMNQRSFALQIGDAFEGGFFAGQISTAGDGIADYNLVVAPKSSGESSLVWKNVDTGTVGADSFIDGPQNTADMVADGNSTVYPCAHFCNDAVIGGFSDWYMPALNELEVCYFNLKPGILPNFVAGGPPGNDNSVPSRTGTPYTTGNPAQTSATDFKTGNTQPFDEAEYWCSTEFSFTQAYRQNFGEGDQFRNNKSETRDVRAVRRVAV